MLILYIMFCAISNDSKGGHGVGGEDSDHSDHAGEEDDHSGHGHRFLQEDEHEGHDDSSESQNAAKFGCAILGGSYIEVIVVRVDTQRPITSQFPWWGTSKIVPLGLSSAACKCSDPSTLTILLSNHCDDWRHNLGVSKKAWPS